MSSSPHQVRAVFHRHARTGESADSPGEGRAQKEEVKNENTKVVQCSAEREYMKEKVCEIEGELEEIRRGLKTRDAGDVEVRGSSSESRERARRGT